MDALLVDSLLIAWVIALIVAVGHAWMKRTPKLGVLSPERRAQFSTWWKLIAARFVRSPREAAWEADALLISLLRELGHPVDPKRLPGSVRKARRWLARETSDGTEALRQAMLQYQLVFARMIGGGSGEVIRDGRESLSRSRRAQAE